MGGKASVTGQRHTTMSITLPRGLSGPADAERDAGGIWSGAAGAARAGAAVARSAKRWANGTGFGSADFAIA